MEARVSMSSPKTIKKMCKDAGVEKSDMKFCTKLVKSCEEQNEKGYTRFLIKDKSGKPFYFNDFNGCFKNSLLFSGGKAAADQTAEEDVTTPAPKLLAPPASADVCPNMEMTALQYADCLSIADACVSEEDPFEIEIMTDSGPFTAKNKAKCLKFAVMLPKMGYAFKGVDKAKKPSPSPKPVDKPSDDSSCTATPEPKPKTKPNKKPSLKPKASVPPAKPGGGSHICYEDLNENQIKYWIKGHGITQISGSLWCNNQLIGTLTMGQYGDDFHAGPVDRCSDGSKPHLMTKYSLDPEVKDAGTLPTDPKKFMTWRCPKKSLKVNTGYKHYYTPKTRAAGEMDLGKLCNTEKVEEGFYFIEGLDKEGKPLSYWFERGFNEEKHHTDTSINSCFSFGIQAEFSIVTGISHYHFHPRSGYKEFGSLYPSDTDFQSSLETVLDEYDSRFGLNPKVFDRRVVVWTGVWTMKLDFDAIRSDPEGAKAEVAKYEAVKSDFFKDIKKNKLKHLSRTEQCALFAEKFSSKFMTITYEPF